MAYQYSETLRDTATVRARLHDAVAGAIDEVNDLRPEDSRLEREPHAPLAGDRGVLDSLAFVNLIVLIEQRIETQFGRSLSLLDDERFDIEAFATVGALVDRLEALLSEADDGR